MSEDKYIDHDVVVNPNNGNPRFVRQDEVIPTNRQTIEQHLRRATRRAREQRNQLAESDAKHAARTIRIQGRIDDADAAVIKYETALAEIDAATP
jgi:hypothetical protein